jgi:hypothetical protein
MHAIFLAAVLVNHPWHAGERAFAGRVASGATQLAEYGAFLWGPMPRGSS